MPDLTRRGFDGVDLLEDRLSRQAALEQWHALTTEQLCTQFMLFALTVKPELGRSRTLGLIGADQFGGKVLKLRMELQQQPVLVQGAADQKARTTDQQGCQPEYGKDFPEQPH